MSRAVPSFAVTSSYISGGELQNVDLTPDCFSVNIKDSITHMAPKFTIHVDNRAGRYNALTWADPISVYINDAHVFQGRIDQTQEPISKRTGEELELLGRGNFGAFFDISSNLHLYDSPRMIVETILAEYNRLKKSRDPTIIMGLNLAPPSDPAFGSDPGSSSVIVGVKHENESLAKMLVDLALNLGSNQSPGVGLFYDVWIDASKALNFVPIGYLDSGKTISAAAERIEGTRILDSLPVKTDLWLIGAPNAGTIPLTMEVGYPGALKDSWSEGNASEYSKSSLAEITSIQDDSTIYVSSPAPDIGSRKSIKINFATQFDSGGRLTNPSGYWYWQFPLNGSGIIWPAQSPGGLFNAYNKTTMAESMGQISALSFWMRTNAVPGSGNETSVMTIEALDGAGNVIDSPSQTYPYGIAPGTTRPANAQDWEPMTFPFGPGLTGADAYSLVTGSFFDWARISQIRFKLTAAPKLALFTVWFDGFQFIKPLVANLTDSIFTDPSNTNRNSQETDASIFLYQDALTALRAPLINQRKPQIYWDWKNVGRNDIPIGYVFTYGSTKLQVRETEITFTKAAGWVVNMKAFEAQTP